MNQITFKIDRSFDFEYPDKKYGIFLDLTADSATGKPALQMFTFNGCDIVHNWINGVGGQNGTSSGQVSSPVAASKYINWGLNYAA